MRTLFYLLIFFCCGIATSAQQFFFYKPEILKQLPANETYNIMQDRRGIIWFSTEGGLCRYNGNKLKVFDSENGLKEGATYAVKEDARGNIWISTAYNRILKIQDDSILEMPLSRSYSSFASKRLQHNYLIFPEKDSLWLISQYYTCAGRLNADHTDSVRCDSNYAFEIQEHGNSLIPVKRGIRERTGYMSDCIKLCTKKGTKIIRFPKGVNHVQSLRLLVTRNKKGDIFIGLDRLLIKIDRYFSYSFKELENRLLTVYCDAENGLWTGLQKGGLQYFKNSDLLAEPVQNLAEYSVSGVCEDYERGIWCTTLENGVFYSRSKQILNYRTTEGISRKVEMLKSLNNKIYYTSKPGEIVEINGSEIKHAFINEPRVLQIRDLHSSPQGWILASPEQSIVTDKLFKRGKPLSRDEKNLLSAKQVLADARGHLFLLQTNSITEYSDKGIVETILKSPANCMAYAGQFILIGCRAGLFVYDISSRSISSTGDTVRGISRIVQTASGNTWIATKGNGLFLFANGRLNNVNSDLQMPSKRLFDLAEDRWGTLWIGSSAGLIRIKNINGKFVASTFNIHHGLPSNEIAEVEVDSQRVYFAGSEGLASMELDASPENKIKPLIHIEQIYVNNSSVSPSRLQQQLPHHQNSVRISLATLSYKTEVPTIDYTLRYGNEASTRRINSNEITLLNLKPGQYTVEIFASNNDHILSDAPAVLSFEIAKPFWQTITFFVLMLVVTGCSVTLAARHIIRRIRQKEEERTRISKLISDYQLVALQAQMNPHFIFNAINSIQNYILDNDSQVAYDYLAKFSRLIRMVLMLAREKVIELERELEMLSLYVQLEQVRFINKFQFVLDIDESVNHIDLKLPPMLIQPYIENAIWHGLMPLGKEKQGILILRVFTADQKAHIIVEDNGIGRAESRKIHKMPKHESVAMRLNEQRLQVLNSLPSYQGSEIKVSDLADENGAPLGTKVEIIIPL